MVVLSLIMLVIRLMDWYGSIHDLCVIPLDLLGVFNVILIHFIYVFIIKNAK